MNNIKYISLSFRLCLVVGSSWMLGVMSAQAEVGNSSDVTGFNPRESVNFAPATTVNQPVPSTDVSLESLVETLVGDTSNKTEPSVVSSGLSKAYRDRASRALETGNITEAISNIENAYISELETFTGQKVNFLPTSLQETQSDLVDCSEKTSSITAVVYPIILEDRLELLVIPPTGTPFTRNIKEAKASNINPVVQEFRANLNDSSSNDYLTQAKQLYDWIIRPIDAELQANKIQTIVFVMDGPLRVVPSSAFFDGNKYLVQKYASASVPSLRLTSASNPSLPLIRCEARNRNSSRVLAMGLSQALPGFRSLPSVAVEINNIVGKGAARSLLVGDAFINEAFTVKNMQAQRQKQDYGIIHLATHAVFLRNNADEAFIQFWDERLKLNQIPGLRLDQPQVEMLTLSACQTAVGQNLGLAGLAVSSGVKSVLASLWAVSDAGTAPLMLSFYSQFPTDSSKAIALQRAQLSLLQGNVSLKNGKILGIPNLPEIAAPDLSSSINLKHPYFWSSFILVGNWL